jgi:hypothetical protein
MSREYRRKQDNSIEMLNLQGIFTDPEFQSRRQMNKDAIDAITEQIAALKDAEYPADPTLEQRAAVDLFNFEIDQTRHRLIEERKDLRLEESLMENV